MTKLTLWLCIFSISSFNVVAQSWNAEKASTANKLFDEIMAKDAGMGSVALSVQGETVYQQQYGFSDLATKEEIEAGDKFHIGSISKIYTAVMVLQAVESGKITLNTKLSDYYDQFENAEQITIEHLLRHRSGIVNFTNESDYLTYNTQKVSKKDLLEKLSALGVNFSPGEKMEYSNSGYVLLSFILEDIYDSSYDKILKKQISKPLKLKSTYLSTGINLQEDEVKSYTKEGSNWKLSDITDASIPAGAGAIVSTPTEVNTFLRSVMNADLLSKESLEMMKEMKDNYGLGLLTIPFYEYKSFGHTGGIDGFRSISSHFPEQDVTVTLLSNAVDFAPNDILIGILSLLFDKPYDVPTITKSIDVSSEALKSYEGTYSSDSFPLDVKVFLEGSQLKAQATGQQAFPLKALSDTLFEFKAAGLQIEFQPDEDALELTQAGRTFKLVKE